MNPEPLCILTLSEAARILRCSKTHVQNLIAGKLPDLPPLPIVRIGRRVLIRQEALKQWFVSLESREVEEQLMTGFFRRR